MTKVVVTASTVVAYSALHTDVPVRTVFAVFTVIAVAAYAIKADPAVEAKLIA